MLYRTTNIDRLKGTAGFSGSLLDTHKALYEGYVRNTNMLADRLSELAKKDQTGSPEYAELNRRFGWEFNGMRLHELYFGNLIRGGAALRSESPLFHQISRDFGSFENWKKDFNATATLRGIGWTILYYEPIGQRLFNCWVTEHDIGHLAGAVPILVLDVFEHAYLADYGLNRAAYIDAFMKAADWNVASSRFMSTTGRQASEMLVEKAMHTAVSGTGTADRRRPEPVSTRNKTAAVALLAGPAPPL